MAIDTNGMRFPETSPQHEPNPKPIHDMYYGHGLAKPPKPSFTVQEEFIQTTRRVNETLDRVLHMEDRIRKTLDDLSATLTADNVAFKNLTSTSYNQFIETVANDVNSFETEIKNAYNAFAETVKNDNENFLTHFDEFKAEVNVKIDEFNLEIDTKIAELHENLNETYDNFRDAIESRLEQHNASYVNSFNSYVTSVNNSLAEMEKSFNDDYSHFTRDISNTVNTFKNDVENTIETRFDGQDSMINDAVLFMKTNINSTTSEILSGLANSGKLSEMINDALERDLVSKKEFENQIFALMNNKADRSEKETFFNFKGSVESNEDLYSISNPAVGDVYIVGGSDFMIYYEESNGTGYWNSLLTGFDLATLITEKGVLNRKKDSYVKDANLITDAGFFYISSTEVESWSNIPEHVSSGTLITFVDSENKMSEFSPVMQMFVTASDMYVRMKIKSNTETYFDPWYLIPSTDYLATDFSTLYNDYFGFRENSDHDANTLDEIGFYFVMSGDSPAWKNLPAGVKSGMIMNILEHGDERKHHQILMSSTGSIYFRNKINGTFVEWVMITGEGMTFKSTLESGSDLNDIIDMGVYQISSAFEYSNSPIGTGMLVVYKGAKDYNVFQTVYSYYGEVYTRNMKVDGSFSGWQELATVEKVQGLLENVSKDSQADSSSFYHVEPTSDGAIITHKSANGTQAWRIGKRESGCYAILKCDFTHNSGETVNIFDNDCDVEGVLVVTDYDFGTYEEIGDLLVYGVHGNENFERQNIFINGNDVAEFTNCEADSISITVYSKTNVGTPASWSDINRTKTILFDHTGVKIYNSFNQFNEYGDSFPTRKIYSGMMSVSKNIINNYTVLGESFSIGTPQNHDEKTTILTDTSENPVTIFNCDGFMIKQNCEIFKNDLKLTESKLIDYGENDPRIKIYNCINDFIFGSSDLGGSGTSEIVFVNKIEIV